MLQPHVFTFLSPSLLHSAECHGAFKIQLLMLLCHQHTALVTPGAKENSWSKHPLTLASAEEDRGIPPELVGMYFPCFSICALWKCCLIS